MLSVGRITTVSCPSCMQDFSFGNKQRMTPEVMFRLPDKSKPISISWPKFLFKDAGQLCMQMDCSYMFFTLRLFLYKIWKFQFLNWILIQNYMFLNLIRPVNETPKVFTKTSKYRINKKTVDVWWQDIGCNWYSSRNLQYIWYFFAI